MTLLPEPVETADALPTREAPLDCMNTKAQSPQFRRLCVSAAMVLGCAMCGNDHVDEGRIGTGGSATIDGSAGTGAATPTAGVGKGGSIGKSSSLGTGGAADATGTVGKAGFLGTAEAGTGSAFGSGSATDTGGSAGRGADVGTGGFASRGGVGGTGGVPAAGGHAQGDPVGAGGFDEGGGSVGVAGSGKGHGRDGGLGTGGKSGAGGETSSANPCDAPDLTWKTGSKTHYTSYPDPGSEECIVYSGCEYEGLFSACDQKESLEWVKGHNIVSVFPDFRTLKLHDLCLKSGTKTIVATVLDECADSDCSGCCTENKGSAEELIDIESFTDARWDVDDSRIQWADLGPTKGSGCQ